MHRLAQVRQKRWQSSGGEEHHVIRDLYHVPGLPHGYDPPLFQKRIEQPLGTSADATEPVELQHPLALARPVLRRAGQLPGLRRGGSEVRSFPCLLSVAAAVDFCYSRPTGDLKLNPVTNHLVNSNLPGVSLFASHYLSLQLS